MVLPGITLSKRRKIRKIDTVFPSSLNVSWGITFGPWYFKNFMVTHWYFENSPGVEHY
jgi:hypothetical protein